MLRWMGRDKRAGQESGAGVRRSRHCSAFFYFSSSKQNSFTRRLGDLYKVYLGQKDVCWLDPRLLLVSNVLGNYEWEPHTPLTQNEEASSASVPKSWTYRRSGAELGWRWVVPSSIGTNSARAGKGCGSVGSRAQPVHKHLLCS